MRMIQQFTNVLGEVLGLRKQHKQELAEAKLDEWLGRSLGLSLSLLKSLSEKDLIQLLSNANGLETDRLILAARVLKENGDWAAEDTGPESAYPYYHKALRLYLEAHHNGANDELQPYHEQIGELLDSLKPYVLEPETLSEICRYLEAEGRFADAENYYGDWLEGHGGEHAAEQAEGFYRRLLAMEDDRLEAGQLPRDEVEDGLSWVQAKRETRA
ncbi:hypothetical protein J31TS4_05640 [Paenibacillus sp. J31TS4]|nr:hypothetical protein J31TS4_05640 [Paenibacillus sp. J31TS4]